MKGRGARLSPAPRDLVGVVVDMPDADVWQLVAVEPATDREIAVKQALDAGLSMKAIAERFGVSRQAMRDYIIRRGWYPGSDEERRVEQFLLMQRDAARAVAKRERGFRQTVSRSKLFKGGHPSRHLLPS